MNVTASGLNRFRKCAASAVLPQIRTTSPEAERGTAIHAFLDQSAYIDKREALKNVPPDLYELCKNIDTVTIYQDFCEIETEKAFALNPRTRTARYLGRSLGRNYQIEPDEIAGSEDVIAKLVMGKTWVTLDFKTGEAVTPAKQNSQLLFFSSCLHLLHGAEEVQAYICYINEDGSHYFDKSVHNLWDINEYLDSLNEACSAYDRAIEQLKLTGSVSVTPGEHCAYCPSFVHCPDKTALAREMTSTLVALEDRVKALTPEQAGKAWMLKKAIAEIFYKVDDSLKEYARENGIDLDNGKRVGTSSYTKRYFSEKEAIKLLEALGAKPHEIAECYADKQIVSVRELRKRDK